MTDPGREVAWERVVRERLPHVVAALTRRHGGFADCEDAAQSALVAALEQWPRDGVPGDPTAWLVRVAARKLVDQARSETRRREREARTARLDGVDRDEPPAAPERDDLLELMVLCCHPALSRASQVALVLRAVGGLTTREVAAGFLVPEVTMAQRISRAKRALADSGARLAEPTPAELPPRLHAVRHAVSLMFTLGHQGSARDAAGGDLRGTALRLARRLHDAVPGDPENAGLLALLLLTEARSPARVDARGDLVPLVEQDRARWDAAAVAEGVALVEEALTRGYVGAFQLQAAIAAVHAEATSAEATDWPQIRALYAMLVRVAPSPAASLGLATAVAEVDGPDAGLALLDASPDERHHRWHAVRGHLLARLGDLEGARAAWSVAARLTRSIPEQRYLNRLIGEV